MSEQLLQDEKKLSGMSQKEMMDELFRICQKKKEDLDHQIILAETRLRQTQEANIREKQEFEIWKRIEKEKFQQELDAKHNQIVEKENALNIGISNFEQRSRDFKVKEMQMVQINEDRVILENERIEIYRLNNAAKELMNLANAKSAEVQGKFNALAFREEENEKLKNKLNDFNVELSNREGKLKEERDKFESEKHNLEELKKTIDPKIAEIDDKLKTIEIKEKDSLRRETDINRKIEEDKAMIRAIEDRNQKLEQKERDLEIQREEIRRKGLVKGIIK